MDVMLSYYSESPNSEELMISEICPPSEVSLILGSWILLADFVFELIFKERRTTMPDIVCWESLGIC